MNTNLDLTSLCTLNISLQDLLCLIKSILNSNQDSPPQMPVIIFVLDPDTQSQSSSPH